ncbi:N-6 DNA methylase [Leptolyngbya sp. AN02str]|uniref:N-6 DNA methylase n=1 Tax=Leptolyngbya sp. AN02str TaxID=3423363 RepID=UPI003D317EB7
MLSELKVKRTLSRVIKDLSFRYSLSEIEISILRLLVFKRLSDLTNEDDQTLSLPTGVHWSVLEQEKSDLAEKLNKILKLIEEDNPHLKGVLIDSEINFWARFDDKTLSHIINLLSELDLSGKDPNDLKQLSEVDAWLSENYASEETHIRGVYTPRQLTKMMVQLMNPQQETSIYDPACGSGEFLTEAVRFIRENGEDVSRAKIYGQTASIRECVIAKANLILHGIDNPNIRQGDIIFEPCFESDEMGLFDIVLLNPPFNLKHSQHEIDIIRESNEFVYGVPSNGIGDFLFVQRAVHSLKKAGRAAIMLPRGVLFREGGEEVIREKMIKDDLIEAVIELAPGLFYGVSIPVTVIIFNRDKLHKENVLFIDASREYKAGRGQNLLQAEHIEHIVSTYHELKEEEGFARLVSVDEIADNQYNLSVNRYVTVANIEQIDICSEIQKLRQLEKERSELEEKIDVYLKALGIKI